MTPSSPSVIVCSDVAVILPVSKVIAVASPITGLALLPFTVKVPFLLAVTLKLAVKFPAMIVLPSTSSVLIVALTLDATAIELALSALQTVFKVEFSREVN